MTEIEKLILQVESKGATATQQEVEKLDVSTRKAAASIDGLKASSLAFYAGALAVVGVLWKVGSALVSATRTYQDFDAQLQTSTGSAQNAAKAYSALLVFAKKTPYDLGQSVNAFIQLVNAGLIPSEKALYAFSDIASAKSRQLSEIVTAIMDAAVGEFRPLKDLGVTSIDAGNKVIFTFKGISTQVNKSGRDIENFLIKLAADNFAGASEKRMKTIGGAISNIGDSWDTLLTDISRQGPDSILTKAFLAVGDALDELDAQITSGQLQANVMAYWNSWKFFWDAFTLAVTSATNWLVENAKTWSKAIFGSATDLQDVFSIHFPAYAKAGIAAITAYFAKFVTDARTIWDQFETDSKATWDLVATQAVASFTYISGRFDNELQRIQFNAKATGKALKEALESPADSITILQKLGEIIKDNNGYFDHTNTAIQKTYNDTALKAQTTYAEITSAAQTSATEQEHAADVAANAILMGIGQNLEAENKATDAQLANAAKLRKAQDDANANKPSGDALAGYASPAATVTPQELLAQQALQKQLQAQGLKDLEANLTTENTVISGGYETQKATILASTMTTEEQKKDLILKALAGSLVSEQEALEQGYETRRNFILSDTQLTEDARGALLLKLTAAHEEQARQLELKTQKVRLDQAADFFGNIASIGSTFGKKGFEIAKAAAIAQATIKTYEAATAAYASLAGIPYIGPELGIAAAAAAVVAGAANIAQIKAQQYTPAYAMGGMIPAGRYGLVGEQGPEIVSGPAVVTSASSTRDRMRGGVGDVTVHNYGPPMDAKTESDGNGNLLMILKPLLDENRRQTKKEITQEIHRGGSSLTGALETKYQLSRKGS